MNIVQDHEDTISNLKKTMHDQEDSIKNLINDLQKTVQNQEDDIKKLHETIEQVWFQIS